MIDTVEDIGGKFDWISPAIGTVKDLMNGPSHCFLIPIDGCPLSGREIDIMFKRRQIKHWGMMIVDNTLMVSVKLSQAAYAQHLLEQEGVHSENPLPEQGKPKRGKRKSGGMMGDVFGVFDVFER